MRFRQEAKTRLVVDLALRAVDKGAQKSLRRCAEHAPRCCSCSRVPLCFAAGRRGLARGRRLFGPAAQQAGGQPAAARPPSSGAA